VLIFIFYEVIVKLI